jgi:uncharacterized protein (TIGR02118 family)
VFVIGVMYPPSAKFDLDYYLGTHIPLVHSRWDSLGLKNLSVLRGKGSPAGDSPLYPVVALLSWESLDNFQAAVERHGKEVMGDIPNFTDAKPVMQVFESVA